MVVSVSAGAHSFSQYVKFSEKRAFLTPDNTCACVSENKKR